ncbi:MAG: hypothetical protein ACKOWK_05210 [Micrococcales bacterium]
MPVWVWLIIDAGILLLGGAWLGVLGARVRRGARRIQRITEPAVRAAEALQNAASEGK